ncbi:hypothetical protein ACWCQM_05915 [Streptomyces sp. NPDC002125]
MRQLSVRVRRAAVSVLTIAVSTGCMSVGGDAGKPEPPRPSSQKGASDSRPDGGTVSGTGRYGGPGDRRAEAQSDRGASRKPDDKASGGPAATPGAARPEPGGPGTPEPTLGGHLPTPEPSVPGPGEPTPPPVTPETPPPSPEPEPSPPQEPPSASPAAQFRTDAMGPQGRVEVWPTPVASPQVAPV